MIMSLYVHTSVCNLYNVCTMAVGKLKYITEKQKNYKSKHKYDLKKFGLSEERIKKDCSSIYKTFLNK